ncbi:hypothetical protein SD70_17355 [Gordoniibacillus kamchatkensis]|uniref:Two-component sensor histidine kinase n=1 Tax=Gordoniibacillus kamchatkensis TaxID=1590651 RepID=A0ABR5AFL4_9BACL|nr:hypothetical protein [Paenibacillus sp. VKM B-2647]KIL39834.1 hypothetical protein SD70_17355 [Paenibacillus sp. VKM B-2647]
MNTVFRKWLTVYLALLIVTVASVSLLIGYFLERDVYQQNRRILENYAAHVDETFRLYRQGAYSSQELTKELKGLENAADVRVSIIGKK